MVRKIVRSGNEILRKKSRPVKAIDKKILKLIQDLSETLAIQKEPEGVGLAACQVGVNLQIFVMMDKGKIRPIVNPKVISTSKAKLSTQKKGSIMEGCLSLPNYYAPLSRSKTVTIRYSNPQGKITTETFTGFEAQIVQHEIDHLNGVMFLERLLEQKKKLYKMVSDGWEEVELV